MGTHLTVGLGFWTAFAGMTPDELTTRRDRVYDILPELREVAPRPAGSVSGGQGKMIALGRALMIGCKLIMLDEPFQGFAPSLAQRYAEALFRLWSFDRDVTLLITEPNPTLLKSLADRTLTIERGEIVDELLESSDAFDCECAVRFVLSTTTKYVSDDEIWHIGRTAWAISSMIIDAFFEMSSPTRP